MADQEFPGDFDKVGDAGVADPKMGIVDTDMMVLVDAAGKAWALPGEVLRQFALPAQAFQATYTVDLLSDLADIADPADGETANVIKDDGETYIHPTAGTGPYINKGKYCYVAAGPYWLKIRTLNQSLRDIDFGTWRGGYLDDEGILAPVRRPAVLEWGTLDGVDGSLIADYRRRILTTTALNPASLLDSTEVNGSLWETSDFNRFRIMYAADGTFWGFQPSAAGLTRFVSGIDTVTGEFADTVNWTWNNPAHQGPGDPNSVLEINYGCGASGRVHQASPGAIVMSAKRYEREVQPGSGGEVVYVYYQSASADGATLRINNNGQTPGAYAGISLNTPIMGIVGNSDADYLLTLGRSIAGVVQTPKWYVTADGRQTSPSLDLTEQAAPGNPSADTVRIYAKDVGGASKFVYRDSTGTETVIAGLDSPAFTGAPTVPTAPDGTNTTQAASTAYVRAAISAALVGFYNLKGTTNCAANPNYPAASKGDTYVVTAAGKIGGAAGVAVEVGDIYFALADNAGGTQAAVGASWTAIEHNLAGAMLSANNLSDITSPATARANLGLGSIALLSSASPTLSGVVTVAGATTTAPAFAAQTTGDSVARARMGLDTSDAPILGFGSGGGAQDTILTRDTTGVLALRNGTANAQSLRIYRTYTDAANYEFGAAAWNGNNFRLGTSAAGTGTARNIYLDPAGGLIGLGGLTNTFPALKRNGTEIQYRLGDDTGPADGAMRKLALTPANDTNGLNVSGSSVTGAGTTALVSLAQTLNTSGDYAGIIVANVTNTVSGANSKLFDIQVGGVSKVWSTLTGILTVQGLVTGSGGVSSSGSLVSSGGNVQSGGIANPTMTLKSSTNFGAPSLQFQNSTAAVISKFAVDLNTGDNYIGITGGSGYFLTFHVNGGTECLRLESTQDAKFTGHIYPAVDNSKDLGKSGNRFANAYVASGVINSSDEALKEQIEELPDEWLNAWGNIRYVRYKWKEAVLHKGAAARWHIGVIAQEVHAAFAAEGLNAFEIGLLCYDEWEAIEARGPTFDEEGNLVTCAIEAREAGAIWSIRADEILFMESAWQRRETARQAGQLAVQAEQIARLTGQLDALMGGS